jgi:hypothetical protein
VLAELEVLLESSDLGARQLLESEGPLLRAGLGPAFSALAQALARFDFEQAQAVLAAARHTPAPPSGEV